MKSAETKAASRVNHVNNEPFFQAKGEGEFFSKTASEDNFFHRPIHQAPFVQAKLTVGQPNDKYEQEADSVADKVVQRWSSSSGGEQDDPAVHTKPLSESISPVIRQKCAACEKEEKEGLEEDKEEALQKKLWRKPIFESNGDPEDDDKGIQRKCAHCEEEEKLQRKPGESGMAAPAHIESSLSAAKGSGAPLPEATRKQMETSMGANFSGVRVHTDGHAEQMSRQLNAQAFTHGKDIYFNSGKYNTDTHSGKHLLAHELTHVIQQNGNNVQKKSEPGINQNHYLETGTPSVQRAWYNFHIPFTDYEFDPSIKGLKTAGGLAVDAAKWAGGKVKEGATYVKDKAIEALEWIADKIIDLVNSGIDWLKSKFKEIVEFASSAFDRIKNGLSAALDLITNPISFLRKSLAVMSANAFLGAWNMLKYGAQTFLSMVRGLVNGVLSIGTGIWKVVSGFVNGLFGTIESLVNSRAFNLLPDFLVNKVKGFINGLKTYWIFIRDFWNSLWNRLTTFVRDLITSVENFVKKIIDFVIEKVIQTIKQLSEIYDFVKKLVDDPEGTLKPYLDYIADFIISNGPGKSNEVYKNKLGEYFGGSKSSSPTGGIIQKAPAGGTSRSTASYDEVDKALSKQLSDQWKKLDIKKMLWESVVNMFYPPATIKAIGHEFYEMWTSDWANAVHSLYLPQNIFDSFWGFWHDVWSNILILCEFPLSLIKRLLAVLMLLMGYVTIILVLVGFVGGGIAGGGAFSVPAAFAGAWAGLQLSFALGEALFVAFILNESTYVLKLFADLFTARQTQEEKDRDYKNIAASAIGMGIALLIVLIFMILSALVKAVIGAIRGGVAPEPKVETKTGETKGGEKSVDPDATNTNEAKTEPPKLEGEVGSLDGQRSVKVTEKGNIWVCESPCQEIRLKYEAEIKSEPKFEERIKKLEEGYSELSSADKKIRDGQIRQLEQELADYRANTKGEVRVPAKSEWPPKAPEGAKPEIDAPNAAEWRYQRYVYDKYLQGAKPNEILPPDEWMRRYYEPTSEGGRPGRPGGAEQVKAKEDLAKQGIKIVENVELGGRYPDGIDPKPNPKGGKNYFEVGKMLQSGIPEARERIKINDEIAAMSNKDTVTFVDKTDISKRVSYDKGSTADSPSSRTFTPKKD